MVYAARQFLTSPRSVLRIVADAPSVKEALNNALLIRG
jgi:hypothetical protein